MKRNWKSVESTCVDFAKFCDWFKKVTQFDLTNQTQDTSFFKPIRNKGKHVHDAAYARFPALRTGCFHYHFEFELSSLKIHYLIFRVIAT